ncbi:TfoX/Sxy family protein [Oceaniglobus roseus]|uniref:TfoX/Sxy family protein n=1 Tax=Oceaniglobus roseus TaxID=1737570 RepID=UPI000C7EED41|nr:TfoX/Sxy family protein [Kandeliimicrobium roseum]
MAYDEGLAELMRGDLAERDDIREQRMFGGLCFLWRGHMLCGVHRGGGMYRVGKAAMAQALALPGVAPMAFTGRPMGGLVEVDDAAMAADDTRAALLGLATAFTGALPAKG